MAAVRRGRCDMPGTISALSHLRSPTDVMVITSLPHPIGQFSNFSIKRHVNNF